MKYLFTLLILLSIYSCTSMKNFDKPEIIGKSDGRFIKSEMVFNCLSLITSQWIITTQQYLSFLVLQV